jgi:hypothetical protein
MYSAERHATHVAYCRQRTKHLSQSDLASAPAGAKQVTTTPADAKLHAAAILQCIKLVSIMRLIVHATHGCQAVDFVEEDDGAMDICT